MRQSGLPVLVADTKQIRTTAPSWRHEAAGAVADLGVLVPIAVGLIVLNGLTATAVLLPAGLLYLLVARTYRLPIAVQPLKAFGAIAIAAGAPVSVIAAGAVIMGTIFMVLGAIGAIDAVARFIPSSVIRGVQLTVAVLLAQVAFSLVFATPRNFVQQWPTAISAAVTAVLLLGLWLLRGRLALIVVVVAIGGMTISALHTGALPALGPTALLWPHFSAADFGTALTLLVIPQLPLTFANSCLAPADAARSYFGDEAARVTPGRLAMTLGTANLLAGSISGMPVCHGAGGLSAHYAFGARSWRAPTIIGGSLLIIGLLFGRWAATLLPLFPVSVLAALLVIAAITHAMLLRDMHTWRDWMVVAAVTGLGVFSNLAYGVVAGLLLSALLRQPERR
ncbi:MAG: molybdate transporter family protein [Candidatus Nanopelagicales bacterium]